MENLPARLVSDESERAGKAGGKWRMEDVLNIEGLKNKIERLQDRRKKIHR